MVEKTTPHHTKSKMHQGFLPFLLQSNQQSNGQSILSIHRFASLLEIQSYSPKIRSEIPKSPGKSHSVYNYKGYTQVVAEAQRDGRRVDGGWQCLVDLRVLGSHCY